MSFQIREDVPHQVALSSAILVYGRRSAYSSDRVADFATIHNVAMNDAGGYVLQEGTPLDQQSLLDMAKQLSGHMRLRNGIIPPNVLSLGAEHVMWWLPAVTRPVYFDTSGNSVIGKRSGPTPHPGLIFLAHQRRLFVYAVKATGRPIATTPLYHAPYFNIWESSQVCTGSTPLPDDSILSTMNAWQNGFFRSNFSHTNHPHVVNYEGGAHRFWADMLDGKFRTFPNKVLRKRGKERVGDVVDRIEEGGFSGE